jgi:hypothetical protein
LLPFLPAADAVLVALQLSNGNASTGECNMTVAQCVEHDNIIISPKKTYSLSSLPSPTENTALSRNQRSAQDVINLPFVLLTTRSAASALVNVAAVQSVGEIVHRRRLQNEN